MEIAEIIKCLRICATLDGCKGCPLRCVGVLNEAADALEKLNAINNTSTSDLVPPPVRCGECVFWEEKNGYFPICTLRSEADYRPHKDGFCDMGEAAQEVNSNGK